MNKYENYTKTASGRCDYRGLWEQREGYNQLSLNQKASYRRWYFPDFCPSILSPHSTKKRDTTCRNVQSRIIIWIYVAGTQTAWHKARTVGLSVCQEPEQSLCSDPGYTLSKEVKPCSAASSLHIMCLLCSSIYSFAQTHLLPTLVLGRSRRRNAHFRVCLWLSSVCLQEDGILLFHLIDLRSWSTGAHACTHPSVLLNTKQSLNTWPGWGCRKDISCRGRPRRSCQR